MCVPELTVDVVCVFVTSPDFSYAVRVSTETKKFVKFPANVATVSFNFVLSHFLLPSFGPDCLTHHLPSVDYSGIAVLKSDLRS